VLKNGTDQSKKTQDNPKTNLSLNKKISKKPKILLKKPLRIRTAEREEATKSLFITTIEGLFKMI